ncbi:MAG TPA: hypothetical protein VGH19_06565 [Verrucomicrobiae bacterium]
MNEEEIKPDKDVQVPEYEKLLEPGGIKGGCLAVSFFLLLGALVGAPLVCLYAVIANSK